MVDRPPSHSVASSTFTRVKTAIAAEFRNRLTAQNVAEVFQFVDMCMIVVTALIAKEIYIDYQFGDGAPWMPYVAASIICVTVASVLLPTADAGISPNVTHRPFQPTRVFMVLLSVFMVLSTTAYVFKVSEIFSRGWFITWFLLSYVALILNRACYEKVQQRLLANGISRRNVLILGAEDAVATLTLALQFSTGLHIVGTHAPDTSADELSKYFGERENALERVDEVIIAASGLGAEEIRNTFSEISAFPVQIRVFVDPLACDPPFYGVSRVGQIQLINVRREPIGNWGHFIKKMEDYILGSLFLLIAIPIFAVIAIAIKLDSRGPVFFKQRRHGLNHSIITVYKFRSMSVMDDGEEVVQAKKNDSRVTPVGAFLRKTSLDELPQLMNVVRGEMSLVGPRPHALAHNKEYSALLKKSNYSSRHLVKPGITGWAQVNGFRGATDDPHLMQERVRCDLYYIDNWSIWFDLEILLLTVVYGFVGKNAY